MKIRPIITAACLFALSTGAVQAAEFTCGVKVYLPNGVSSWQFPTVDVTSEEDAAETALQVVRTQFPNPTLRFEVVECF
ncbi:hypothetical protein ABRP17_014550 [Stenotrophomonas sp. WHRI 8082]|uniref:hypothetical protein n=1 Tax=Stenotrophomonas sp. WHRI 8082 TaxID=3162571 RepID=UPI0032EE29A0